MGERARQFAGGPLVPLRYTIREHLERIGDPAGTTYPFSARYLYHPNGTVWEAEFYSAGSSATAKRYRYVFGTTSYDALNRLKSADFSSWSGSSWTSTLAHDLTGINYDLAGNITALQRYRETGSLLDNLTYSNATTSNRLNSVSDAVGATIETWDAETGSFTYDANGNLTTAPAPYSITAVTYDHQNLPVSLTSAGTTKTYRYTEAGQRITKQVGTGNTEVYLLDGATSLGVFTVNSSGSLLSWHFNVLAGDKVVGRQPHTGNRRYYHTDLLGSTRAVVEGASVVESYDFEPWGLVMPGRTLAGPTKEGFTSKERDAESGLDYFGARYYMAALGRWTAVDPLAEKHPEWSPYNYVLNNPLALIDPDGRQVAANAMLHNSTIGQAARYLSNMSPQSQLSLMKGELQIRSQMDLDFERTMDQIPLVVGLEAQFPAIPGVFAAGASLDMTTRGPDADVNVSTGGFAAAYTFGVKDPSPERPGEFTGTLTLAAGVGFQIGFGISKEGVRLTDFRLAAGVALKATQKVQVTPSAGGDSRVERECQENCDQ